MRRAQVIVLTLFFIGLMAVIASCSSASRSVARYEYPTTGRKITSIPPSTYNEPTTEPTPKVKPAKRKIIYIGRLGLEVFDLKENAAKIEATAKEFGGFTEKLLITEDKARITVRVPVEHFREAFMSIGAVGRLLNKEISAADVTREFSDLQTELKNKEAVRERLYYLLKITTDVEEKVRILREIERLNKSIETSQKRLKMLSKRASFSTIICDLSLYFHEQSISLVSPFSWIAGLNPSSRSLKEYKNIEVPLPPSFFSYEKSFKKHESESLFISAHQSELRAGRSKNEPQGDLVFWGQALEKEMLSRGYIKEVGGDVSPGQQQLYRISRGLTNSYYQLGLFLTKDYIYVVEIFYPDKQQFDELYAQVTESLKGVKIDD